MSELTLYGNLYAIQEQLLRIKTVTDYFNLHGFALLQPDEEWHYFHRDDTRVCPTCLDFGFEFTFRGDEIPTRFPHHEFETWYIIKPKVHVTYPDLKGKCRCHLTLQNPLEVFERRLHDAKLDVLIDV